MRILQLLFTFKIWQQFQITMSDVQHWALNTFHFMEKNCKQLKILKITKQQTDPFRYPSIWSTNYRRWTRSIEFYLNWKFHSDFPLFLPHKMFRLWNCRLIWKLLPCRLSTGDSFSFCSPIDNANSTKCNSFLPNGDYSKFSWKKCAWWACLTVQWMELNWI